MGTRDDRIGQISRRLERLREYSAAFTQATTSAAAVAGTLNDVRIRNVYVALETPTTEGSDRRLPPRERRPPATRLVTPQGSLLRFSLVTLLEAQAGGTPPGARPRNIRSLVSRSGGSDTGWRDLFPTVARVNNPGSPHRTTMRPREKVSLQLTNTLKRLADTDLYEMVRFRDPSRRGMPRYENFELLHEGGRRPGGPNIDYHVPDGAEAAFALPTEFFTRGWVYVLTENEIALLLAAAHKQSFHPPSDDKDEATGLWRLDGPQRISVYGLGPDAYNRHSFLEAVELLQVVPDPTRGANGRVSGIGERGGRTSKKDLLPHQMRFLPEGLEHYAIPKVVDALEAELDQLRHSGD